MQLVPEPHVPEVLSAEVVGIDGSKAWGVVQPDSPTGDLWVQDGDRCNLARLVLTRAGCIAAAELLLALGNHLPVDDLTLQPTPLLGPLAAAAVPQSDLGHQDEIHDACHAGRPAGATETTAGPAEQ